MMIHTGGRNCCQKQKLSSKFVNMLVQSSARDMADVLLIQIGDSIFGWGPPIFQSISVNSQIWQG